MLSRPKRLSGIQCLQLLEQLNEDESENDAAGTSPSGSGCDSESSIAELRNEVENSSDSSCVSSDAEVIGQSDTTSRLRGRGRGFRGRSSRGRLSSNTAQRAVSHDAYIGRDGTVWSQAEIEVEGAGRRAQQNVFKDKAGPTPYASRAIKESNVYSAFKLLIDEPMLRHSKKGTEAEARRVLSDESWTLTLEELEAITAIVYARGASGAKGLSLKSLWDSTWGLGFAKQTMARDRFCEIMKYLRFDMKSTRQSSLKRDKFALASEIWYRFIKNSKLCYVPGENITVDEQLFPMKTRCRFIQYIANKPDKFGVKFWLAVDVDSKYLVNGFPYLGKDEERPVDRTLGHHVVQRLMEPYLHKGRNVTTDNFFTGLKLAKHLKDQSTSIVGTVNRARRELPSCANDTTSQRYESQLLKHEGITLTIYRCKPSKNVVILSTVHTAIAVGSDPKKTPESIEFYNATKFGVDVIDQMARKYSVKAGSRRWPIQIWYNVLDSAAINSWILYKHVTGKKTFPDETSSCNLPVS